ncbi:hypothetical protein [Streptomyces cucumeris]|uniref:hypothetical protein n=1 Tax=Streptomyces cucumeris TaxID=2962890 RepID=UPI003EBBF3B7
MTTDDDVASRTQDAEQALKAMAGHRGPTVVPGIDTASGIMRALRAGRDTATLFPDEPLGGHSAALAMSDSGMATVSHPERGDHDRKRQPTAEAVERSAT